MLGAFKLDFGPEVFLQLNLAYYLPCALDSLVLRRPSLQLVRAQQSAALRTLRDYLYQ